VTSYGVKRPKVLECCAGYFETSPTRGLVEQAGQPVDTGFFNHGVDVARLERPIGIMNRTSFAHNVHVSWRRRLRYSKAAPPHASLSVSRLPPPKRWLQEEIYTLN
jgi:hypothetical protein